MLTRIAIVAVAGSVALGSAGGAEFAAQPAARADSLGIRLDSIFARYNSRQSPGCAVAVVRDGEIVAERGYGMADLQHDIPITPASIFHVASISKQFTALSVALLARQGKLSLDDDIRKHIPELPDFGHTIAIRHLIHHTSGLRDQWSLLALGGWRPDDPKTEADILELVRRQRALNFPPGEQYLYSNTGYTLLAVIVKRVAGKSLREFADSAIFRPLGMHDTHFHDDHTMIVKGRTSAYEPRRGGGASPAQTAAGGGARADSEWRISIPVFDNHGATSLFTTVRDLAKWERNFLDPRVGDPELLALMHTRGKLADGEELPYAFALVHGTHRGLRTVGHGGADAGYRADFVRFPDQRVAIATLCNVGTANPGALARQVADIFLATEIAKAERTAKRPVAAAKSPPPRVDERELARYAGVYLDKRTESVRRITVRDGKLWGSGGGSTIELVPVGKGRFQLAEQPVTLTFRSPGPNAPLHLEEAVEGGKPVVFEPVRAGPPAPGSLAEYAGTYESEELGVIWTVRARDSTLVLQRRRFDDLTLQPAFTDAFSGTLGLVRFTRDEGGKVTGFTLTAGRVRFLRFERR